MKRNKLKEFFGFKYVYNTRSKQIHFVDNLQVGCHFKNMKNGIYCTRKKALKLINVGDGVSLYQACVHCLKIFR